MMPNTMQQKNVDICCLNPEKKAREGGGGGEKYIYTNTTNLSVNSVSLNIKDIDFLFAWASWGLKKGKI